MNTAMKLSTLLILVLLGSLELVSSGPLGINTGSNCCPDIKKGPKIPLAMVVSYHKTSSSCAKAAVVFVTKRKRRICVNPSEEWVRSHMTHVDSRSRKATTVSLKTTS
ncbi:C-C motif chemokine 3-like [Anguilla anguilla]|uniref:C-C motif chemokine 3-like n=1 Tax=Anguilla anguilla TaxID=7936 RepID=UPI0015A99054|nr:C-C motif chemokine 3-like [Anguilla anguilla]